MNMDMDMDMDMGMDMDMCMHMYLQLRELGTVERRVIRLYFCTSFNFSKRLA